MLHIKIQIQITSDSKQKGHTEQIKKRKRGSEETGWN